MSRQSTTQLRMAFVSGKASVIIKVPCRQNMVFNKQMHHIPSHAIISTPTIKYARTCLLYVEVLMNIVSKRKRSWGSLRVEKSCTKENTPFGDLHNFWRFSLKLCSPIRNEHDLLLEPLSLMSEVSSVGLFFPQSVPQSNSLSPSELQTPD
jgi:hypothetical protein